MLTNEFMQELQKLTRAEKMRVVQVLVNELASDADSVLSSDTLYEVWSPYDSADAAATLMRMLEEDKQARKNA
jgi:hypothetical protein